MLSNSALHPKIACRQHGRYIIGGYVAFSKYKKMVCAQTSVSLVGVLEQPSPMWLPATYTTIGSFQNASRFVLFCLSKYKYMISEWNNNDFYFRQLHIELVKLTNCLPDVFPAVSWLVRHLPIQTDTTIALTITLRLRDIRGGELSFAEQTRLVVRSCGKQGGN